MNDYSDLIFLIGAIAIYALLANNTNQTMLQNNQMLTSTEMEYGAISVAQDVVEKARWMSYDQATPQNLESVNQDSLYTVQVTSAPWNSNGHSEKNNKKLDIKVTSKYLQNGENSAGITMSYIKTDN